MWKAGAWILVAFGCVAVLYYSWLPNPNIGSASYFPRQVGVWINKYGNLRTAIPFIFIAIIVEISIVKIDQAIRTRAIVTMFLLLLVLLAEIGQIFIADRHFDPADIIWAFVGTVAGLTMGIMFKLLLNKL